MLDHLTDVEYLPEPSTVVPRAPMIKLEEGYISETIPKPQGDERVCFLPFLLHGFGFPLHPFFRGLHFYALQLHHRTPNWILHIACFITLCEAFQGIEPHFGLWRKYFQVKLETNADETCECGGAAICKQSGSGYLDGTFAETNKK